MTPQEAILFRDVFVATIEHEMPVTRKVIERVPDGQKNYKPDSKSMSANELAWHLVTTESWFLEGVANGKFAMPEGERPAPPATVSEILSWYDQNVGGLIAKVKAMSGESLARVVPFFGMEFPNVHYLPIMTRHSVHHRGQLSTYLRPMGSTVPSIYGGSADEPFQG